MRTRVTVTVFLDNLAAGDPAEEIVKTYHVTTEDVSVALGYSEHQR